MNLRTTQPDLIEALCRRYGPWAKTYGHKADDGLFAYVRDRENRIIREYLPQGKGYSVLDAGSGPGVLAKELKRRGHEVWAVDCVPEMVAQVKDGVDRAILADLRGLDLGRRFDLVLCIGALQFIAEPLGVLRRLREHLVEGGRLIVLVPHDGPGGWLHRQILRRDGLESRLYTVPRLRTLADEAGLSYVDHRVPFLHNFVAVFRAAPLSRPPGASRRSSSCSCRSARSPPWRGRCASTSGSSKPGCAAPSASGSTSTPRPPTPSSSNRSATSAIFPS